jgi:hypothetical protein
MSVTIQALKRKITSMDVILQGTLLRQYKRCGKRNCRCRKDEKYWHGPYWIWTRKEKGKTITKNVKNREQVEIVKKAFKNMKEIHQILEEWKSFSLKTLEDKNNLG